MKFSPRSLFPEFKRPEFIIYSCSALVGILSGLVVVGYRAAISFMEGFRETSMTSIRGSLGLLLVWMGVAIAAGLLTALLVRRSPLIKGSGIPQVKAQLAQKLTFTWKRELPSKFLGGTLAIGAGLSLGREGPSIQLGALIGDAVDSLRGNRDYKHYLVTAGAAAGISAAFNAPLAGVLFCIEELHKNFSPTMLTSTLIASFCANAVMWLFYGSSPVFAIVVAQVLPLQHYLSAVLMIGVAAGLLGSLFNWGILGFQKAFGRLVHNEMARIAIAFSIAAVVSLFMGSITGGGSQLVDAVAKPGISIGMIGLLLAAKLVFTLFSYASGAPGGIFLPMLTIGALIGAAAQILLPELGVEGDFLANYILLGMAAFFVAVVRAPITGAVLITEMAGSLGHFPAFILVSVVAVLVAELLGTRPIYDSLLDQLIPAPR